MSTKAVDQQVAQLQRRAKALADFGTFAFREGDLQAILDKAACVCAACLDVPFSKICRFQPLQNDLLVVAGHGWNASVVGVAISVADETSPQGRAFITGLPQLCPNIAEANGFSLPSFYAEHGIRSTVDVLVAARAGPPFGVLEVDSQAVNAFDEHDIDFLTGFANVLAEGVATAARNEELKQTIRRMQELDEEKETLAEELKHRVRNSFHMVYGLLTAELDAGHEDASIIAFRSVASRVLVMGRVFDQLLGAGMSRTIDFGDYVTALCENLRSLYETRSINLVSNVVRVQLELDDATALGIIITEIVNNAYLHAFPNRGGDISVTLLVALTEATIIVADNGIGFVEIETKRRGMNLVRRLVQQVGGTISLRSHEGSAWTIRFPLQQNDVDVQHTAGRSA
jgi:two-component sensor histidine kinase